MAGGMWHVETFAPRGDASVLASFLKEELLPYMRSRGFNVKVFLTQYALGPDQFWLLTELDSMASFDKWPQMAEGEPRGRELMDQVTSMVENVRASVVRDLEMSGHGR